jgi:AcrR family transcriptional regulator
MSYFIEATVKLIEEEGMENVTTRKIADLAGYNSASIYNYFNEISHLYYFAAMTFLKKYTDALPGYMAKGNNSLEKYLSLWECFCHYSFKDPQIYNTIFLSDLGTHPGELSKQYYSIFPADIVDLPDDLKNMVLEFNLSKRGRIALEKCVEDGFIKEENAEDINEMASLIWQGNFIMYLNNRRIFGNVEEATDTTMKYIRQIILKANEFEF